MKATPLALLVNGEAHIVDGPISLAALLDALGHAPEAAAVAVNEAFVPRSERSLRLLASGDRIVCFRPIVGG